METAVLMKDIVKRFPDGVVANNGLRLEAKKGEIHVILGENGAGKSTLMNILYGLYRPDAGEIVINGNKVNFSSPRDAVRAGIGMVHQHFMLIPTLTVAENIILGSEPCKQGFLDIRKALQDTAAISQRYGLKVDPQAIVKDLSVGIQQRVEILKALYKKCQIIIFDEPTAVLTPQEVEELFAVLDKLRQDGHTVLFITHKLKEIKDISDRVTVIRHGRNIRTVNTRDVTKEELAELMVGRAVALNHKKSEISKQGTVLELKEVSCHNQRGLPALNGVNFKVAKGEIVGIAGVDGNGQTELIEVITGLRRPAAGEIYLNNENVTGKRPQYLYKKGLSHIPEDRHKHGLIIDFSLVENFLLGNIDNPAFSNGQFVNYEQTSRIAAELIDKFAIKIANIDAKARTLSGGNQQKVIVAREIYRNPDLLVAAQPTRGLDVGAVDFIHEQILAQRQNGKGVLLISMELDEVFELSDRILVMYNGGIVGEMDAKEATMERVGFLMAGLDKDVKK